MSQTQCSQSIFAEMKLCTAKLEAYTPSAGALMYEAICRPNYFMLKIADSQSCSNPRHIQQHADSTEKQSATCLFKRSCLPPPILATSHPCRQLHDGGPWTKCERRSILRDFFFQNFVAPRFPRSKGLAEVRKAMCFSCLTHETEFPCKRLSPLL